MKRLVILENDAEIKKHEHRYSFDFMNSFDGEIDICTHVYSFNHFEILEKFKKCSHIVFQTSLVGGSQYQVESYLNLLRQIEHSIDIHMIFFNTTIFEEMIRWFSSKELLELEHHNFFEFSFDEDLKIKSTKVDFSIILDEYKEKIRIEKEYKDTAVNRLTGRKIKILACTAKGSVFEKLSIGSIVDELDMSSQDPRPERGVWVQGNGEPVKLVNDTGIQEYEIAIFDKSPETLIDAIFKTLSINKDNYDIDDFIEIIQDESCSTVIANEFCELLDIAKRGNRRLIANIIENIK